MEFSSDFLNYLKEARAQKLRRGEMDIGKTGAETGLLGAQAGRINALTPFEARQMAAQTGLLGAQKGKTEAETLSEYGMTAPSQAQMGFLSAQTANLGAKTMAEYGLTAPAQAQMFATRTGGVANLAQAANLRAEAASKFFQTPMGAPSMGAPQGGYFSPVQSGGSMPTSNYRQPYTLASNYTAPSRDKLYATPSGGVTYMNPSLWKQPQPNMSGSYGGSNFQILPPPPPRKDINVGLGGRTYTANFASFGGYPATGNYNQRSGGKGNT